MQASFDISALEGRWSGKAERDAVLVGLELDVDWNGFVSGSGVRAVWNKSGQGRITGGGSFTFISGSSQVVSSAEWDLKINDNGREITGILRVMHSRFGRLNVNLKHR